MTQPNLQSVNIGGSEICTFDPMTPLPPNGYEEDLCNYGQAVESDWANALFYFYRDESVDFVTVGMMLPESLPWSGNESEFWANYMAAAAPAPHTGRDHGLEWYRGRQGDRPVRWALLATMASLLGCNRQAAQPASDETGTTGGRSEAELDDSDPEVCREAPGDNLYYQCGDECVWLHASRDHCGACFNECRNGVAESECREGRCAPFRGDCIYPESQFSDCSSYCAANGGRCELGDGACASPYTGYTGDELACEGSSFATEVIGIDATCDDPINWDARFGGESLIGVRCCCVF